jgi:hypothetical protein
MVRLPQPRGSDTIDRACSTGVDMRFVLTLICLALLHGNAFGATQSASLNQRCVAAIAASGQPANIKALKQTTIPMGESGFLFQFTAADGGTFTCQICDDGNPAVHACGSIGLELSFRPKDGELKKLPAELDKKCTYFLQKEMKPRSEALFIDHAIVQRIHVTPDHSDKSWVYQMELDGNPYRCVIRKSDGNFRLESKKGDDWRPIAAGILF